MEDGDAPKLSARNSRVMTLLLFSFSFSPVCFFFFRLLTRACRRHRVVDGVP